MFVQIDEQHVNLNNVNSIHFATGSRQSPDLPTSFHVQVTIEFANGKDMVITKFTSDADQAGQDLSDIKSKIAQIFNDRQIYFGVIS